MKTTNFKEGLVEAIKVAGQMIIDNADDIAGKTELMSSLNISVEFDPEMNSIPELTIIRSHLPKHEQLNRIFDTFAGKKDVLDNSDKTGEWIFMPDHMNNRTMVRCDLCGETSTYQGLLEPKFYTKIKCDNCGAKMEVHKTRNSGAVSLIDGHIDY